MSKCKTIPMPADAWREAMAITPNDAPGYTVSELAVMLNISRKYAEKHVACLVEQGKCTKGVGTRVSSDGKHFHATVYNLE